MAHKMFFSKGPIRFGFLFICMLLLTSCAEGDAHITVHRNGQADLSMDLSVSDKTLAMIGKPDLMTDVAGRLQEKGMKVEPYERNGESGLSAARSFTLGGKEQDSIAWPEGIQVNQLSNKKFLYTQQQITVSIDLEQLIQKADSGQQLPNMSAPIKSLLQNQLDFEFLLTLPIQPGDNNANELQDQGRTLVWNLKLFEPNQYTVTLNVPNIRNIAYVAGCGLIAVLILAWTAFRIIRKRNSKALILDINKQINERRV